MLYIHYDWEFRPFTTRKGHEQVSLIINFQAENRKRQYLHQLLRLHDKFVVNNHINNK